MVELKVLPLWDEVSKCTRQTAAAEADREEGFVCVVNIAKERVSRDEVL